MIRAILLLAFLSVAGVAHSQTTTTTTCQNLGTIVTCNSNTTDPHQYDFLRNAGKKNFEDAGRAIGEAAQALADSINARKQAVVVVDLLLALRCGNQAAYARFSYSDGSSKVIDLGNETIDQSGRDQIKAAFPMTRFFELVGC